MIELSDLVVLAALALFVWYLIAATKRKEAALQAVQQHCGQAGVQLLDGTVALRRLGLGRDATGRLHLERRYQFEFTATGTDRNSGWARMLGQRITAIELAPHRFNNSP